MSATLKKQIDQLTKEGAFEIRWLWDIECK